MKHKLADRGDRIFALVNRNETKVIQWRWAKWCREGKDLYCNRLGNGKGRPIIDCGAALRAQMRSGSMNLDWITVDSFSLQKIEKQEGQEDAAKRMVQGILLQRCLTHSGSWYFALPLGINKLAIWNRVLFLYHLAFCYEYNGHNYKYWLCD